MTAPVSPETRRDDYASWHREIGVARSARMAPGPSHETPRPEDDTPVVLTIGEWTDTSTLCTVRRIMQLSSAEYCALTLHLSHVGEYTSPRGLWSVRLP